MGGIVLKNKGIETNSKEHFTVTECYQTSIGFPSVKHDKVEAESPLKTRFELTMAMDNDRKCAVEVRI